MDYAPTKRSGSQPDSPDSDHRSRQDSGHLSCSFPQTVKEAVAIAAGKKGASSKVDDRRKTFRSNMLCYLYWLLVLLILGLISFTVWLSIQLARRHSDAMNSQNGRYGEKEPFTFEDIFNSTFKPKSFDVQWIRDRDGYVYRSTVDGSLYYFDVANKTSEKLMDKTIFEMTGAESFSVSSDLKYVLLKHHVTKKWRHTFTAKYSIYGRSGGSKLLSFPNDVNLKIRMSGKSLQYADWAPTTSSLVFAFGNNIYYQPNPESPAKQLTVTGDERFIFNGVTDWLYEEEILRSHVAVWWSPISRYICYASFNDTLVPLFKFPDYGSQNLLSGNFIEFAYPKAGDLKPGANTQVKMFVVDTENIDGDSKALPAPSDIINKDHYVVQVAWRDNSHVTIVWSDRAQNKTVTTIYNVVTGSNFNNLYQTTPDGWLEPLPPMTFIRDGSEYLTIMAQSVKDTGTWNHVALVTAKDKEEGKFRFLTHGLQEIVSLVGYDEERRLVYYISTNGDPKKRHLLRVEIPSAGEPLTASHCVSCLLGKGCQYVESSFSSSGRYFVLGCLGPDVPTYRLMDFNGTLDKVLEDNAELTKALNTKILPEQKFVEVPIGGGHRGLAEVLAPPGSNNNDEKTKKYPLLVYAQNGPGTQLVTEKFHRGRETYLTTSEEVVVAYLDGRGASSRGNKFKYEIHRKLGAVDVEDELLGGLFFKTLDYVDPAKSAIWGWSYGGFVTSHSVANETDVFPCGITGAALPDSKSFDTAYFERYMGYASDNEDGYENTDVIKKYENLRNKKFMIIHGTASDNIPFASSIPLIRTLTESEIQFRFQFYTDLNRYSVGSNRHMYRLMTEFLKNECFSYFWRHETQTWIVDKSQKKEKFRIKQFCV